MTGPTVSLTEAARHSPRSIATLRRWWPSTVAHVARSVANDADLEEVAA